MPTVLPSTVDVVVSWAKANTNLNALLSGRVSSTLPRLSETQMTYPWLQVQRIIGEPLWYEIPADKARIQFNAWGGVRSNGMPNWGLCDPVIRTLEAEIREFTITTVGSAVIMEMAGLEGIMQLQDPDTGEARFWMDALVTVRNA